jgi:hypothetical protein
VLPFDKVEFQLSLVLGLLCGHPRLDMIDLWDSRRGVKDGGA